MIENTIKRYKDVELVDIIDTKNGMEITLHDHLDKGIDFEQDVKAIVDELKDEYYIVEWEVYNTQNNREDDGYELAFINIII